MCKYQTSDKNYFDRKFFNPVMLCKIVKLHYQILIGGVNYQTILQLQNPYDSKMTNYNKMIFYVYKLLKCVTHHCISESISVPGLIDKVCILLQDLLNQNL